MAILKKRTSSRRLPEARGLDRAPLDSIIRGVGSAPSLSGRGASSITSAGGAGGSNAVQSAGSTTRPFTSTFTNPDTARPTLTTKTSSVPKTSLTTKPTTTKPTLTSKTTAPTTKTTTTTTKPTVTTKTATTPTTKTTTPTSVVKPTVKPNVSNPNSTTNKVVNALTGAAIGAGTKLLIDKITGKPVAKTDAPVSKQPKISNNTGTPANSNSAKVAAANTAAKKAQEAKAKAEAEKLTSKVLSEEEVLAELDRAKASEEAFGPPEGAIKNADGTYTVFDGNFKTVYNSDGSVASMESADKVSGVESLSAGETLVGDDGITVTAIDMGNGQLGYVYGGYTKDGIGPKSGGTRGLGGAGTEVVNTAENANSDSGLGGNSDTVAGLDANQIAGGSAFEPEYFDDGYGNIYISTADGGYDLYRAAEVEGDGEAFTETPYEPEYFEDSLGNIYMQGESGEYELYRAAEVPEDIVEEDYDLFNQDNTDYNYDYDVNDRYSTEEDDGDEYYDYRRGGLTTMMKQGGVAKFQGGGYVDNGDGTYSIGNFTYDSVTDEYLYSTDAESGNISNVSPDAVYSTTPTEDYYDTDSFGNVFKNGSFYRAAEVPEDITAAGGGNRNWYDDYVKPALSGGQRLASDALSGITGALGTTAGAAGAGALVATLLGQDFGGGTGAQNQGLDMSQVGVINPRTTDFGIGPTRFVGYEDYGTGGDEYTPNEELLRNLNAPGFNPVNEGDYGYEEVAADETEEAPKMASGGLSSMATPVSSYYTFGQPADILANLGMRAQPPMNPPEMMPQIGQQQQPQQTQQQGLPQQAPPQMAQQVPQGMPQQGMMPQQQGMPPPMRKGGLPHVSNVPMTEGRMDFRRGSAVHGAGDGQSDDIPAMLADGEYVIDAETVAQIGNGSTKAGAQALDKFRESIRAHKRSAPVNKIPPKTKALTSYLKGAK